MDHKNMMEQLEIKRLRPGPSGRTGATNSANYDPAKANPFPNLPDPLVLKDGRKVTTPEMWWKDRRPEIVEDFEREVVGRVPKNTPKVTWTVVSNVTDGLVGKLRANGKRLIGRVDNSAYPEIEVNIQMTLVTPATNTGRIPVLMMVGFGGGGMPRPEGSPAPTTREFGGPYKDPPSTEQLIAAGWGYASIIPSSIQADNGGGFRKGIIGLCNKGEPRKPDDWGSLRAWQWGVSRLIDYFEANPDSGVDAKKVGIEGLSRYGKAALVTEAFEPRIAVGLIGSSGEGGAKLHRHIYGEAVENLAGGGEYHWMAGNFIKYGASEPEKTAADLPVDSHELIAMCAPRPCFISYGVVSAGDAKWVDAHGSFMAGVLAGPVYRLLGKKDFGTPGNYLTDEMPPVGTLIGGELAWRQHSGGHTNVPNFPAFYEWAGRYISTPGLSKKK